jgi:hypothetical protein
MSQSLYFVPQRASVQNELSGMWCESRSYNHVYVDTMKKNNKKNTAIGPESVNDKNDSDKEDNKKRKISALVMWHLPVIDHLKCVFSNPRDAELVR